MLLERSYRSLALLREVVHRLTRQRGPFDAFSDQESNVLILKPKVASREMLPFFLTIELETRNLGRPFVTLLVQNEDLQGSM